MCKGPLRRQTDRNPFVEAFADGDGGIGLNCEVWCLNECDLSVAVGNWNSLLRPLYDIPTQQTITTNLQPLSASFGLGSRSSTHPINRKMSSIQLSVTLSDGTLVADGLEVSRSQVRVQ